MTAILHNHQTITAVLYYRRNKTPYFGLLLPPKSLPPKNAKPPTAKKLPPYCIAAEKMHPYFHILVYRFRQSRYRQKRENRQPPKNYRRMAIPPRLCPRKKTLPTTTLKNWFPKPEFCVAHRNILTLYGDFALAISLDRKRIR